MTSLSARLKALGVQLGAKNLQPPTPRVAYPVESVVGGSTQQTEFGEAFLVERFIPSDELHGANPLRFPQTIDKLAMWAADTRVALLPPERFLFLDTESTGLWGSGTLAFLIGLGRFETGGFRHQQYFLREPIEERAVLEALNRLVHPDDALVTFNGKSFDLPLLQSRYLTNGAQQPFRGLPHLDLLHLARRLWKDLLPSRALGDLEVQLLGVRRTEEDIPGWMIPQMYIDYLHTGDARPLAGVFYHNSMDVLSMATLLNYLAAKLASPFDAGTAHHAELYAIGRLYVDLGFAEDAIQIFRSTLSMDLPKDVHYRLVESLGYLFRRRGDYQAALQLWEQAAAEGQVYAHVEIAKYYEHRTRDYSVALHYTRTAIEVITASGTPDRVYWQPLLEHRLARLERKAKGSPASRSCEEDARVRRSNPHDDL